MEISWLKKIPFKLPFAATAANRCYPPVGFLLFVCYSVKSANEHISRKLKTATAGRCPLVVGAHYPYVRKIMSSV